MTVAADEKVQPVEVATPEPQDDDGLTHYACECSPDRALCSTNVTNAQWVTIAADDEICVVCAHMEFEPCPRCGQW